MWSHLEVANQLVVVLPLVVRSLVHPAATFWLRAALPVLRMLQCMYAHVHIMQVPLDLLDLLCI